MIKHTLETMSSTDKHTIDMLGLLGLAGVFAEWLPVFVLFLTAIWTMLRIYETPTVQKLVHRGKKEEEDEDGEGT